MWEEIESLNVLPAITQVATEFKEFLNALQTQQDEQRLFQFLNGLDDSYETHRSHILMQQPLPTVDEAYNVL